VAQGTGVVLLDYDQAEITQDCLRSVASGTRRPDGVVLVENGASPVDVHSDELIASLGVRVLRPGRNIGAAAGRNLGIDALLENALVDRVVLLDNDTVVPPDFFELAAEIEIDPLGVAAPLVLDLDTEEVIYAGGDFDGHRVPEVISEWPEGRSRRKQVDWAPTAALLVTRDGWRRVGGFDPWLRVPLGGRRVVLPGARGGRGDQCRARAAGDAQGTPVDGGSIQRRAGPAVVAQRHGLPLRSGPRRMARSVRLARARARTCAAGVASRLETHRQRPAARSQGLRETARRRIRSRASRR
jgi:Glycosyl transferase family 2